MALCWDDKKVALQIDADPLRNPRDEFPEDWTVLHLTDDNMASYDSFREVIHRLSELLGEEWPSVEPLMTREVFASLQEEMRRERSAVRWTELRRRPYDSGAWSERLPDGSTVSADDGTVWATPEFEFLRFASTHTIARTVQFGMELCSLYAPYRSGGIQEYRLLDEPFCDVDGLRSYLRDAKGLPGYDAAMQALNYVAEESLSPMGTFVTCCLCLPREMGGYDLVRPSLGGCFVSEPSALGRAPSQEGPYMAYDLCWPWCGVALQYTGEEPPSPRQLRCLKAAQTFDIDVVCLTRREIHDPDAFEEAASLLARKLDERLPEADEAFLEARAQLRASLEFPSYDHMELTNECSHCHELV